MDELCSMITQQQIQHTSVTNQASSVTIPSSLPTSVSTSSAPSVTSLAMASTSVAPVTSSGLAPGIDVQTHMMQLLTDSFSKLSSVLADKSTDTKSDWPKFSGDSKKFRAWYMSIMAQLSLPSWTDLYDSSTNDIVVSTADVTLNGKLYSKLLLSLEGQLWRVNLYRM